MNIELKYKQALKEYNVNERDLPEDAQIGISVIADSLKAANMLEKSGKSISEKAIKKIKATDKWVYYEILDMVNDTDKNEDEMPYDKEEVIDEIEDSEEDNETNVTPENGQQIELELRKLFETGKKDFSLAELKSNAKNTYNLIFDTYDESGENGVETTNYSLIETKDEIFTLTKN